MTLVTGTSSEALPLARRLKRVFGIEIEQCVRCGGRLSVVASIEEPELIERILAHRRERGEEAAPTTSLGARASRRRGCSDPQSLKSLCVSLRKATGSAACGEGRPRSSGACGLNRHQDRTGNGRFGAAIGSGFDPTSVTRLGHSRRQGL
jgi:hypothetical protein